MDFEYIWDVILDAFRSDRTKKYKKREDKEDKSDGTELTSFKKRISNYRESFTAYNQTAPGFDYIAWKPYGYWRDEDHSHTYISQCHALAPWVRETATAGCVGLEERRWEGLIGQPEEALKSQYASRVGSRLGSRENLLG